MTFSDVSTITTGDDSSTKDLYQLLVTQFRVKDPRFRFKFKFCERSQPRFTLTDGIKIVKTASSWDHVFISDVPLTNTVNYFEIEIVGGGTYDGLYVGVTEDTEHKSFTGSVQDSTRAIYNNASGNINSSTTIEAVKSVATKLGDVFGVVTDKSSNSIRYYLNGEYAGTSKRGISDLKIMYAFVAVFYDGQAIQLVERYPYRSLKNE
jgi:hypothetical protein